MLKVGQFKSMTGETQEFFLGKSRGSNVSLALSRMESSWGYHRRGQCHGNHGCLRAKGDMELLLNTVNSTQEDSYI